MRVIGTAGHVDHGKSTLVQALTGTHPDRLKEEREREMTIDLGFAWLTLPNGEEVGIVDVPGHRDFIENMLAGVGGIDAALFVVAADEGVMPQTREHLAILDLLQIQGGVVALTKIDMVGDDKESRTEWLDLVESDLRQVLAGTVLAEAPIQRVSAKTGEGLSDLKRALTACLEERPPRPDTGKPRLPVDRVFTIAGFGTVVTGTLSDGVLRVGDEVEVLPQGLRGRVRGLQTHKQKEDAAVPGGRTAVNISGVALEDVRRGDLVAHPGDYRATRRFDANFRLLPDASQPIHHNTEVKLYIGASETIARLRLLGSEELLPGETGWVQLEPTEPVVAVRGDRYILRRPSPGETLGGGMVVEPHPRRRHKRFSQEILSRLESLLQGSPADVLLEALQAYGASTLKEVMEGSNLGEAEAAEAVLELIQSGQMIPLEAPSPEALGDGTMPEPGGLVIARNHWEALATRVRQELDAFHKTSPLRGGMPREELRSRLKSVTKGSARLFNAAVRRLSLEGSIEESGNLVRKPGFTIRFNPVKKSFADRLLAMFSESPYTPPSVKESTAVAGEDVYAALIELGQLVQVGQEVVFRKSDYERMVDEIRRLLETRGTITAAEVRDHFNTSRKYALALLEHLDAQGLTVREGDIRRLRKSQV
jgi:selenocysteine-specific elongation factor